MLKRGLASRYEWSSPTVTIAFYANAGQIVAEHLSRAAAGEENDAQAAGTSASTAAATGATAAGCTCETFAAGPAARFAG